MEIVFLFYIVCVLIIGYLIMGICTTIFCRLSNPLLNFCKKSQTLCLTFDDGIDPRYTPLLLDILENNKIKASFFILASTIKNNEDILQRMIENGHTIGFHSMNHKNQITQFPAILYNDFKRSIKIFEKNNVKISYYRPPWGHVTPLGILFCKMFNLKMVLWTVIIGDWSQRVSVNMLRDRLCKKVNGSAVICLHDGRGKNEAPLRTIAVLKEMIPYWKKEGYTFETISEFYEKNSC